MTVRSVRLEARSALRNADIPPVADTAIFLLLTSGVSLLFTMLSLLLSHTMEHATGGIAAMRLRSLYSIANTALYILSAVIAWNAVILQAGYRKAMLERARGNRTRTGTQFSVYGRLWKFFALYIVETVYVFFWSCLFVIPGLVAAYRYRLAVYFLLDNPDLPVLDAIRRSKAAAAGRKGFLFRIDLSFWPYYLLLLLSSLISGLESSIEEIRVFYEALELELPVALPVLSDAQSLVLYLVGLLIAAVAMLLWMPHLETSFAVSYLHFTQTETAEDTEAP